jgi:hypothetical protein
MPKPGDSELIHQLAAKFEPSSGRPLPAPRVPTADHFRGSIMRVVIAFAGRLVPSAATIAAIALATGISAADAAEAINVIMDQAKIARVPERTATLVVGNPLIADVSVQSGGAMVVTGKGYGVTNVIALDRGGKVLFDRLVRVKGPMESVVIYRGATRESYTCEPYCERRITLGDTPDYFIPTLKETTDRNDSALGKSPNSNGGR